MATIAGLQDFRQQGPPADIGTYQMPCDVLVFEHVFAGTTYYVAARAGERGWILVDVEINATPVIQSAINDPTVPRLIQINLGYYNSPVVITAPIEVRGMLTLRGRGQYGTYLQLADGVDDNMFEFTGGADEYFLSMEHMGLDGNSDNNAAGSLLHANNHLLDVLIFDCFFNDAEDYDITTANGWNWRIIYCTIENAQDIGVYVTGGSDLKIVETKFLYNACAFHTNACHRARIFGCFFYRNTLDAVRVQSCDGFTMVGAVFRENSYGNVGTYQDIYLGFGGSGVEWAKLIANYHDGQGDARMAVWVNNVNVTDTTILGCTAFNYTAAGPLANSGTRTVVDGWLIRQADFIPIRVFAEGGTATILNTAVQVVVGLIMAGTPDVVLAMGRDVDTYDIRCSARGAASITLTVPAGVGGDRIIDYIAIDFP